MASISFASVNIEGAKHLDLVESFLKEKMPEVLCLQELFEKDVEHIANILGWAHASFTPMMRHEYPRGGTSVMGIGIFSRLPVTDTKISYYVGDPVAIVEFDRTSIKTRHDTQYRCVLSCDVEKEGTTFRFATTHFTWTPKGGPDDYQRQDIKALLGNLASLGEFTLSGDFNAPRIHEDRPGEIFSQLAAAYKDNIPATYKTSLDPTYHRAPLEEQADKMVDGLFTTPEYTASDVALHTGVSDHCAMTATISRS